MKLIDEVYLQMKRDVFRAMYKPNEFIVERDIAEKYGVSKVTAGEVLHRLCAEGHLTGYPRSGYMVTTLSPTEMEQLKRLRVAVESLALEIVNGEASEEAVRSLYAMIKEDFSEADSASVSNSEFHMALARLTNDRHIVSLIESLLGSASRVEQRVTPEKHPRWQDCHKAIVDALLSRDVAEAKRRLLEDINQR